MPFTGEERIAWLAEKQKREQQMQPSPHRPEPVGPCVSCQRPIGISEGTVTDEFAICDICSGD